MNTAEYQIKMEEAQQKLIPLYLKEIEQIKILIDLMPNKREELETELQNTYDKISKIEKREF